MSDLPRVSDILALLYPNSLNHVRQEHLDRGSVLHEGVEIWINNQLYGYEQETDIPPDVLPVLDWFKKNTVEFHGAEEVCAHSYGFQGHPDILCRIGRIDYWIDLKFAEALSEQNMMQGTAYCYLTGRKGLFLQCKRDKTIRAVKCKPNPKLWAVFLAGLQVWKFREKHVPTVLTPAEVHAEAAHLKELLLCQTET